jgi:hypothetical protein
MVKDLTQRPEGNKGFVNLKDPSISEKIEENQVSRIKKWQLIDLVRSLSIVAVMADHSFSNPVFNSR